MPVDTPSLEAILLLQPSLFIPFSYGFASLVTRLGEAQILLPAMAAVGIWMAHVGRAGTLAWRWVAATAVAGLLTTVSKVAFIGYGLGYAPLDYAGISGHALFSAAILPVLMRVALGRPAGASARLALGLGVALALLIAVTRVKIGAHSWIEVLLGFGLGTVASRWVMRDGVWPGLRPSWWLPVGLAIWLAVTAHAAPPSQTHGMVTRLALAISGRAQPYTRQEMRRAWRAQQPPPASTGLTQGTGTLGAPSVPPAAAAPAFREGVKPLLQEP